MNMFEETYLGDGLYVSFEDGQVKLRAPRIGGDEVVYLEAGVLGSFLAWLKVTGIADGILR